MGRRFKERLASLERSQWWTRSQLAAWQDEQVRQLIAHAFAHVPYYRNLAP
jgi:phenylacetate-CoA ligase